MRPADLVRAARELAAARSVVGALVVRDLKARYRAFGLGYLWSLLNPLLQLAVYTWIFREILRIRIPGFTVFLAAGIFPWAWFAGALSVGALAVVQGGSLIRRMYFPTQALPVVVVLTHLVHFLLSLPVLFLFALLFRRPLGAPLIALPLVIAIQLALTLGATLVVAALNVRFRDLELILGNVLLLLFFVSPVLYGLDQVPKPWQPLLVLNPLTGLLDAYQHVVYLGAWPRWGLLAWSAGAAAIALVVGWAVFEWRRWSFAEQV